MNAYVLHGINEIRLEEVEKPMPEKNEVIIQVKAVGICGSDIPRIYQTGAHVHPLIPGHEFSGVVVETGKEVDCGWLGQRVGIFPLIPCKTCTACKKKQYEMCRNYSYLGSRRDGAFTEYVAVPEENLIPIPDSVSFESAAMMEPMSVAVHAMRRIAPDISDTVAICGLGTIGLLLLMFLKEAGVRKILAIGNKEFQKQTAMELGLDMQFYCDSRAQDVSQWLMEQTEGEGVDVFFECVGKNDTFIQAIDNTASAGKVMLVGNPYSDMKLEKPVYWKILRNQLMVTGSWNSTFTHDANDDWHYVLERISQNRIKPDRLISHRLPLEELERGFHIMRDKSEDYVKIMGINSKHIH